jgi:hypothetical protein|tara:strand:- start:39 stop:284 length:246 start_codon:yes stop_codon:yes gene_type:complete
MMKNVIKKNKDGSVSSEIKKVKIDAEICLSIYYSFDEEIGYTLDTDSIRKEFEEQLNEIEDDISNLNHERDEHLRTKYMEG